MKEESQEERQRRPRQSLDEDRQATLYFSVAETESVSGIGIARDRTERLIQEDLGIKLRKL